MKSEDTFAPLLDEIRSLSKQLNVAVDSATDEIEALEKRLVDAEPGVSVWGPVLLSTATTHSDDETGATMPVQRTVTLGFGRGKKKWGFLVRDVCLPQNPPNNGTWSEPVVDEVCMLRKADRELRLLALPHLAGVVQAVREELQQCADRLLPKPPAAEAPQSEPITIGQVQA